MSAHPPLQLDPRQRAMLAEMGVRVWLPEDASPIPQEPALAHAAPPEPAPAATQVAFKAAPARAAPAPAVAVPAASQPAFDPDPPPQVQTLDWPALSQAASACQACAMCQGRKNTVLHAPAASGQTADWLVVGEAPDEEEDRQGLAFVGEAGVLLDNMLAALGLKRLAVQGQGVDPEPTPTEPAHSVYLSHALQCRPPAGRSPQLAEVSVCRAFLEREIALVRPKVILAMGRLAALAVLSDQPALLAQPMGKQRGTLHQFQGIPVVITYSPHYLLRNSADKAKAWLDLNLAADALESA
jgi:DNA polymerase